MADTITWNDRFVSELKAVTEVLENELMSAHTTFRTGGPCDFMAMPKSTGEIIDIIRLCKEFQVPYYILGNGSDLLVGDKGYRGVMINIASHLNAIDTDADAMTITAGAGALLSRIAAAALNNSFTGMECESGIPGTLGGACVMNAGAYGGEMKDIIETVTVITPEGEVKTLTNEELELGYRTSVIPKAGYIVTEAVLKFQAGDIDEIKAVMDDLKNRRISKQPLDKPSAGSTFKRPEGYFAGKLIEDAGLRGYRVGDAAVSEKHCGFVVNLGKATSAQVKQVIDDVTQKVFEIHGVTLEPEVKMVGEF